MSNVMTYSCLIIKITKSYYDFWSKNKNSPAVGDNMLKIVRTKEEVWNSHPLTHKEHDDDMHWHGTSGK